MFKLYRNSEVMSITIDLLKVIIIGAIVYVTMSTVLVERINNKVINNNRAIVGGIVKEHPELETEIVRFFTKPLEESDIKAGTDILAKYGYSELVSAKGNKLLKEEYRLYAISMGIFFLVVILLIYLVVQNGLKNILGEVSKITLVAEKVVEGEYKKLPVKYEEGEIAVLTSCINSMVGSLENSIGLLNKEKKFLNDIISDITHQLKTPLASLIMFNDILCDINEVDEETIKDCISSSKSQLDRMEWLVLNLLKLARLEAGSIRFNNNEVLLSDTINKAIKPFEILMEANNQKLILIGSDNIIFKHDPNWTAEALSNLIKNAIEHSSKNSNISIICDDGPLSVRIKIIDEGKGIPKKEINKIFQRFYRGQESLNPNSIGIGLSLTKSIIEGQDGEIRVISEEGVGTTFIITMYKGKI